MLFRGKKNIVVFPRIIRNTFIRCGKILLFVIASVGVTCINRVTLRG